MNQHEKINYIELPAADFKAIKHFFSSVFGWQFTDYGSDYMAFENAGLAGGFYQSTHSSTTQNGAALVVFYSVDLTASYQKILQHGGIIEKEIFEFPGGRRFHFLDPCGNEYAVWSDVRD